MKTKTKTMGKDKYIDTTNPEDSGREKGSELGPQYLPEIQKTIGDTSKRSGEVIYSTDQKELGKFQTVEEALTAYDDSTAKVIEAVSSDKPGFLNKALQQSRQAWAASNMAVDRIKQEREKREIDYESANAEKKLQIEKFAKEQAALRAVTSEQKAQELVNKMGGPIRGLFANTIGAIGEGLGKALSGFVYSIVERRRESKKRKHAINSTS